jgi:FAD dependent oxidoreductase TIGR03364
MLHERGKRVVVLERNAVAKGASVRNFGMVWPVGHPLGEVRELALRSRELWLAATAEAGIWHRACGSMTLAYEDLEVTVLEEFLAQAGNDPAVGKLISPEEVVRANPCVKATGLKAALHSTTELCVDPRTTVTYMAQALVAKGVQIYFNTLVGSVAPGVVTTADGTRYEAEEIVVCASPDGHQLVPMAEGQDQLRRCDLQMLRLFPKVPHGPQMGTHLCAGLTLGHYANFRDCPSLSQLKQFHAVKWPKQVEFGIHVLVSQHADGSLTVGDSHSYGDDTSPYGRAEVDSAILTALDEFLDVSDFEIGERWIGTYSTSPGKFYAWMPVDQGVHALSLFGTGMTLSFGVAERVANQLFPQD